jgi:hypothetical protein
VTIAESTRHRRVFLSYTHSDRDLAQRISDALDQSGIPGTSHIEVSAGEDFASKLGDVIGTNDFVVLLLSPAAFAINWVDAEGDRTLSGDLDQRGVELIPVLAVPTDLPPTLRDRTVVDLTSDVSAGVRQLVTQINATSRVDFSAMTPRAFEEFVADLLRAVGFNLAAGPYSDSTVDFRATYHRTDPFGLPETEVWFVEAKLYSHKRVSVEALRALAGAVALGSGATRGLLVTNTQLTSVAREFLHKLDQSRHVRLQVIDGVELRNLIRRYPAVAVRHFAHPTESGNNGDS